MFLINDSPLLTQQILIFSIILAPFLKKLATELKDEPIFFSKFH